MQDLLANGIFPQPLTARKCKCSSPDVASGNNILEHGTDDLQTLVSAAKCDRCPLSFAPCFCSLTVSHSLRTPTPPTILILSNDVTNLFRRYPVAFIRYVWLLEEVLEVVQCRSRVR